MPRKTRKTEDRAALVTRIVAACIAAFPFDADATPDAPHLFPNLPETETIPGDEIRVGIASSIAADRAAGFSGNDLRGKYAGPNEAHAKGRGLTGPMRRRVLRDYGYGSLVARSYSAYVDGTPREGSAHARMHGPRAAERAASALFEVAESIVRDLSAKDCRTLLRDAGRNVPQVRGGDESALRVAATEATVARLSAAKAVGELS